MSFLFYVYESDLIYVSPCRMDEMMHGQTGQRELAALAEKDLAKDMIEGLISPRKCGQSMGQTDCGSSEEVSVLAFIFCVDLYLQGAILYLLL